MTREDVLKVETGRITDKLVATKVMGWRRVRTVTRYKDPACVHVTGSTNPFIVGRTKWHKWDVEVFNYSQSLFHAWDILEKFRKDGGLIEVEGGLFWLVHITPHNGFTVFAGADILPLAICRAALLAVMEKE